MWQTTVLSGNDHAEYTRKLIMGDESNHHKDNKGYVKEKTFSGKIKGYKLTALGSREIVVVRQAMKQWDKILAVNRFLKFNIFNSKA